MANESIRQLADALGMATARLSGDPQRMQMALGLQQSRKLQEEAAARQQKLQQFAQANPSLAKMFHSCFMSAPHLVFYLKIHYNECLHNLPF